ELMSKHSLATSLSPAIDGPTYKAGARGDAPAIDASASFDPQSGEASFFIVNRKIDDSATVTVKLSDRTISKVILAEGISGQDTKLANSWEKPNAVSRFPVEAKVTDGTVSVPLKAPGFAAIRVSTNAR